jgi:hypothetical protein
VRESSHSQKGGPNPKKEVLRRGSDTCVVFVFPHFSSTPTMDAWRVVGLLLLASLAYGLQRPVRGIKKREKRREVHYA